MLAASRVDTWNNLRASSTSASPANDAIRIFANDSEILMIASNCLKTNEKKSYDITFMFTHEAKMPLSMNGL